MLKRGARKLLPTRNAEGRAREKIKKSKSAYFFLLSFTIWHHACYPSKHLERIAKWHFARSFSLILKMLEGKIKKDVVLEKASNFTFAQQWYNNILPIYINESLYTFYS